ncbi:MAG: response regulator [Hyphomicrobiales bacterium]|nr:response regulator [Hyphomicrobiales bacterium]
MPATTALHAAIDPSLAFVIDDDAELRRFVTATLKQLGMRVADFEMAKDALASLDSVHPAVIFLDVALLRSDAIDVLRGLGERRYAGRVQLMSGGRPSLLQAVQRIGVRHGINLATPLNKPFTRDMIARTIETFYAHDA